ncbi:HBR274Wp [Eremothecium sinecaudum]|uniref:Spindle pole body component 110 n=1 Tax=Eremothecium sinecaudum TaxID=45286 RepID=A0A109UX85_9SACH|nr:HBR274Wp [Eremothecium sinecaudum]AMD19175.1 HBR274Wp [Eremothecium sinecaudum]
MFSKIGTPADSQHKKYEFTPIGHLQDKENMDAQIMRQAKRASIDENDSFTENSATKKSRVADETITSQRLFNDTSFDDTIPEQSVHSISRSKKDPVPDLITIDSKGNSDLGSNPLKEQQNTLQKLTMENYSLRVKCNSLLKFLNNVSDDGQLRQSLEVLDELQEWKTKHHELIQRFRELQLKFDELDQRDIEQPVMVEDHSSCEKLRNELELSLAGTNEQLNKLRKHIKMLEGSLESTKKEHSEKELQHTMNIDMLKSDINQLRYSLSSKETALKEAEEKIQRLVNQLQEYDHDSGALLELEKKIDEKNQGIQNLETRLQELSHQRQSLERELRASESALSELRDEYEGYKVSSKAKLDSFTKTASSGENILREKINSLEEESRKLNELKSYLEEQNKLLKGDLKQAESRIELLESERERILTGRQEALDKLNSEQLKIQDLNAEVIKLREIVSRLETENGSYKRRIGQYVRSSPSRKAAQEEVEKKEREVATLRTTLRDLEQLTSQSKRELEDVKLQHKRELMALQSKLDDLNSEKPLEQNRLQKEIDMLKLELRSIQDTKQREIRMWETKCESLKNTYEQLLKENGTSEFERLMDERRQEFKALMKRYNDLTSENISLTKELNKQKTHKESYKEDLKKVQSRLEFITKEFVKLKENTADTKIPSEDLNARWQEKYQSMRTKLLNEIKSLQDENIELEKQLLDNNHQVGSKVLGAAPATTIPANASSASWQDRADYYRLKYYNEVKRNNDLKVVNEYLNRVLKASSQHVKLDILKLENEVQPLLNSTYADNYDYPLFPSYNVRRTTRLNFKSVALLVLACVRMSRASAKRRWDQQRLNYLQRKIALGEERLTW